MNHTPQIKICGLTNVKQALACASCGANAIGCVFYSKSPRNVTDEQAQTICKALPEHVKSVGVFVNETYSTIMKKVEFCGLKAVQLHGEENPDLVYRLHKENLLVIKALFMEKKPSIEDVYNYNASAYLIECGVGKLPGGNALEWNWEQAKTFGDKFPLILAGGLSPENISRAAAAGLPHAVDVSSGVESKPGHKDLNKVKTFISNLVNCSYPVKRLHIF